ncbi:MAG: hypothetical protein O2945_10695 [Planctomycetota bacterium]|nr:hypothetical protein [Planctomycetota bacterium]
MQRTLLIAALLALASSLPNKALAQADINAPASDAGIPTLLDPAVLNLPDVQFIFDGLLDPERISLIQQVTRANRDDPRLTNAARSIINNHLVAMQQVELAIQFLQSNRDDILAGNNTEFNSIFGNPGDLQDIAVVNPTPLSGLARVTFNAMTGGVVLDFQDNTMPNLPGQIKPGDFVFVGDAVLGDPLGFIVEVDEVLFDDDGSNQMINGTSTFGGATTTTNRGNVPVHRIITFEQRTDPARFERVVQTFTAIKDSLAGLDINLPPLLQTTANPITYQRSFEDINNVWAPGVAPFTTLDDVVRRELSRTGLTSTRTADRLVRQAGLSNSDSHFHLDRLDDQGLNQRVDYRGRATFPLLWSEDNEIPLTFGSNSPLAGATDEDRAFFRDRQTIFGEPDNPFVQYIGRAFLEETIFHNGDFFDTNIAVADSNFESTLTRTVTQNGQTITTAITLEDDLLLSEIPATRPIRGPVADIDGNPQTPDFDIRQIPESGVAIESPTERRKWQMIIESFAEHSTDLDLFNVAAIGIADLVGEFPSGDILSRDAGKYADFAALIGSASSLNGIDPGRIEPFGKRGSAGFNPVVPRN